MITMMQASDPRHAHDPSGPPRHWFDHPEARRLLLQSIMNAILVVILEESLVRLRRWTPRSIRRK
jgi:hypothetical protein